MQPPVIFQPPQRMVVILAETCPTTDIPDPEKYDISTELCPVIAIQCEAATNDNEGPAYHAVIVTNGEIRSCSDLGDRASSSVHVCTWPPEEDAERLKQDIETLKIGLRGHVEFLRKQGEPAFHTADTYFAEKEKEKQKAQEAQEPAPKRRGRPKKQPGQEGQK